MASERAEGNRTALHAVRRQNVFLLAILLLTILTTGLRPVYGGVVVSEIMYNPVGSTDGTDHDEFEFIELHNDGLSAVTLTGAYFSNGITYAFTGATSISPGSYLVVVKNREAFQSRYPDVSNIAPETYTGSLSNDGEKVTLRDATGNMIFSVEYDNGGEWPEEADGYGASLVLADASGDPDKSATWCASDGFNGTPGSAGECAKDDIVINEVLTHTDPPVEDAIELYNLTADPTDIGGWYLSDQAKDRKKYRIPFGTVIPGHGYAVFYEYQFNDIGSSVNVPFALSSNSGDQLYLTAADASGNLTQFADMVRFEASENGISFGRYPNGTGPLITLAQATFGTVYPPVSLDVFRAGRGAENSEPKVGPVIVSEIMYHPRDDGDPANEYIELRNITDTEVKLYDPDYPLNTWKLSGAADFMFPGGVVVPPGGCVLVAGAEPSLFRAAYGLSSDVPVYGPWTVGQQLSNSGESVRLYRPDSPDEDLVPYILVDRADYKDASPWPTGADGQGYSLERKEDPGYGSDPANWQESICMDGSPGRANIEPGLQHVISALQTVAGMTQTLPLICDINGDGKIGMEEAIFILQKISDLGM